MTDIPIIRLEGSDVWTGGYEWGQALDAAFPEQEAPDFAMMCVENAGGVPDLTSGVVSLVCTQVGQNDEGDWEWMVTLGNGEVWHATGGCDYTGWDCRSWTEWHIQPPTTP